MADEVNGRVAFPVSKIGDMRFVMDPMVPLARTVYAADGTVERTESVLCWVIDGDIYVHPVRMEMFSEAVKVVARKLGWTGEVKP